MWRNGIPRSEPGLAFSLGMTSLFPVRTSS